MVAAFALAVASPAAISVMLPETNEITNLAAAGVPAASPTGRAAPLTTDESEWIALWKNHAPPQGRFSNLMAAISKIEEPLKRDVFKAVTYSEWVDKRLPIPGNLEFSQLVPLFEQMLAKDPVRAGEMAASFNTNPKTPRYLEISSKLASLVGNSPEGLASFINLVAMPSTLVWQYGITSYPSAPIALTPQSDNARAGHIRDAIALLAERNPALAEATVASLRGWHRDQALAGLIIGQTGMGLDAAITALAQRSEAPGLKENVLEPLLKKWIEIDPRRTLETLDQLRKGNGPMTRVPSGKLSSSLLRSDLLAVYAERDFAGGMAFLTKSGSGMDGAAKLYTALARELRENPGPTLDAMEKLENRPGMKPFRNWTNYIDQEMAPTVWDWCAGREPNNYVRSVASTVLIAVASNDPALAAALYLRNPGLATEFPSSAIAHGLNIYSVDVANRILGTLPDTQREDTISAMLQSRNLDWDVSDCLALYERLDVRHRDISAAKMSARLAEADPHAAATWALNQPEGQIRKSSVSGLSGSWADSDPVAAAEWVNRLESGDLRDTASWKLADKLADQGDFLSGIRPKPQATATVERDPAHPPTDFRGRSEVLPKSEQAAVEPDEIESPSPGSSNYLSLIRRLPTLGSNDFFKLVQQAAGGATLQNAILSEWAKRYPREMFATIQGKFHSKDDPRGEWAKLAVVQWMKHNPEEAIRALDAVPRSMGRGGYDAHLTA